MKILKILKIDLNLNLKLKYICLLFIVFLFPFSCGNSPSGGSSGGGGGIFGPGGGGGGGGGSAGSMGSPYVIPTEPLAGTPVTYSGVTSTDFYSFPWNTYLTFLNIPTTPNQSYIVTLTGLTTNIDLYVTNDGTYATLEQSSLNAGILDENCQIDITGNHLYIMLRSNGSGEAFTITVSVAPQGTSKLNPFVGTTPVAGTAGTYSYDNLGVPLSSTIYMKFPVTAGFREGYEVTVTGLDGDLRVYAYEDANYDYTAGAACTGYGMVGLDGKCTVVFLSPGATAVYVTINTFALSTTASTKFTINVRAPNSGELGNPLVLTAPPLNTTSTMPVSGGSLYITIPATSDAGYITTLSGMTSDLNLQIFSSNVFDGNNNGGGATVYCLSNNFGTTNDSCDSVVPAPSTNLYVQIINPGAVTTGAPYTLDVALSPLGSQGNPSALAAATVGTPTTYSTAASSTGNEFFKIPVSDLTVYLVELTGLSTNYDLSVYSDPNLTNLLCTSGSFGTVNEKCTVANFSGYTYLYIKVTNVSLVSGAYTLTVTRVPSYSMTMSTPTPVATVNPGGSSVTDNIFTGVGGTNSFDTTGYDVYLDYTVTPNNPYMVRLYNVVGITGTFPPVALGVGTVSGGVFTPLCTQDQYTVFPMDDHDEVCLVVPTSSHLVVAINSKTSTTRILASIGITAGTGIINTAGTLFDFTGLTVLPASFVTTATAGWSVDTATSGNALPSLVSGTITDDQSTCVGFAVDTTGWTLSGTTFDYWTDSQSSDLLKVYKDNVLQTGSYSGANAWTAATSVNLTPSAVQTIMWCYEKDWFLSSGTDTVRIDNVTVN